MSDLPETEISAVQSTIGLLLALLTLAAISWVVREVTGQRGGRSARDALAARWRATWPALAACWRWWLSR